MTFNGGFLSAFKPALDAGLARVQYLLRDGYTTPRSAGGVDGTAAEPGSGVRSVTDSGGAALSLANGRLWINGYTNAWHDPGVWYGPWPRADVGAVSARVRITGNSSVGNAVFMAGSEAPANPLATAHGVYFSYPAFRVAQADVNNMSRPDTRVRSIDYQYTIIPRSGGGMLVLVSGGIYGAWPAASLLWIDDGDSISDLYAGISNYNGFWYADDFAVVKASSVASDFGGRYSQALAADTFTRSDGALGNTEIGGLAWQVPLGAASILGNALSFSARPGYAVVDTSTPARVMRCKFATANSGSTQAGICFRMGAAPGVVSLTISNTALSCFVDATAIHTGAIATLERSTTYTMTVIDTGSYIGTWIGNTMVMPWTASTAYNTQTQCGVRVGGSDSGTAFLEFEAWPSTVDLSALGITFPAPPIGFTTIASDDFTNSDGMALTTHNAAWSTSGAGSWEINSNKARMTAAGATGWAVRDVGIPNHESEVTIVLPGLPATPDWFCGVTVRWTDANNYIYARYLYQSNSPEVEVWQVLAGDPTLISFTNLGPGALTAGSTHTLKVAANGIEVAAYHDGELVGQSRTALTGTRCGIGITTSAQGQPTFDNWIARQT